MEITADLLSPSRHLPVLLLHHIPDMLLDTPSGFGPSNLKAEQDTM
jgi:hypothetical protein